MNRETLAISLSLATVVLAGLAWSGSGARAQSTAPRNEKHTIQTTGVGTVRVRPDHARVFFGVQTFAPTVKQARAQNASQSNQVAAALNTLRIPDLKMKSTNMTVELVQSDGDGRVPKTVGYRITNTFTVLVHEERAEKLGPLASRIMDTALENGANLVQQISFFREDQRDAKRQALTRAVEEARANAEAMAAGAGQKIEELLTINGQPQYELFDQRLSNVVQSAAPEGDDTPLMAGEQEITCTVSATYSF